MRASRSKRTAEHGDRLLFYADDVVILHRDLETLQQLQDTAEEWLVQVGLRFKPNKTRITHTLDSHEGNMGFDFLGFQVRQYKVGKHRSGKNTRGHRLGFKTLIKPSHIVDPIWTHT